MDGPVATCAGSAGGAEPPRRPSTLPAHCESGMKLMIVFIMLIVYVFYLYEL